MTLLLSVVIGSYVRKNAVLTVFTIYQVLPELIPDAPELIEKFMFAVRHRPPDLTARTFC